MSPLPPARFSTPKGLPTTGSHALAGDTIERYPAPVTAALLAPAGTSAIDQDPPHRFSGGAEEVTAVRKLLVAHQPQISFMHERCGVERLPRLFLHELLRRELAQLVIDQREKPIRGVRIALIDGVQDVGNFGHDSTA